MRINGLRADYADEKFVKMYQKSGRKFGEYFKCHVDDLAPGHVKASEKPQEN